MRLIIKHKGGEKIGNIPERWDQLTVSQFLALEQGKTDLELLSILSGIDLKYIENTNADLNPVLHRIFEIYNEKPPNLDKIKKKPVTVEGKTVKMPGNINNILFGQKSMVQDLLRESEDVSTIISKVFAIFLQPVLDGSFDTSRIEAVTKVVDKMLIVEVFPHVLFFFKKLNHWKIVFPLK